MAGSDDSDDATQTLRPAPEADTVIDDTLAAQHDLEQRLVRGTTLGRYVVEERVGKGGMGVVYAARDPELHRRVALKLLLPDLDKSGSTAGRMRLLREAQAMAQVSHRNVLDVYDVGTFEDHVFLALEFIDGEPLSRWLKRERRSWRDVVSVFVAAGRGLAAAHAAGLIHRDFKPDNVMIAKDGRVLVMDFGLARAERGEAVVTQPVTRGAQPRLATLTEIGEVLGTPGYTAPEHLDGITGDARSDQFSFAVSLYAGVYGRRPWDARTFAEYRKRLDAGLPDPPATSDVPAWVRRAIERGLALDPGARFATMDALLDALSTDPAIRRRRWLVGGLAIVALVLAAVATVSSLRNDQPLCTGAERKLAGVWDDARRAALTKTFLASDRPYARTALAGVIERLDNQARAWTAMHKESCEATRLRGEQPASVMTLRMACLDQRLRELDQLVDIFVAADAGVVERSIGAASALSGLDACTNTKALLAAGTAPADLAIRATVDGLRKQLARSKALFDTGKLAEAAEVARPIVAAAHAIAYRPLEAEALIRLAENDVRLQAGQVAVDTLRAAARAAEASHNDEIRARALAWMVGVLGDDLGRPAEALVIAEDARAAIERLGGDRYIESILESSLGRTYNRTSEYAKMLEHHQNALNIRRKLFDDDDPHIANAYNNVAVALTQLGRYREALDTHRKAFAIRTKLLGVDHPDSAMSAINIGNQYYNLGDLDQALSYTATALTTAKRSLPAAHEIILIALANEAAILAELDRFAEANAAYDELFLTLRARFPKSARMARALSNHAVLVLIPTGHPDVAVAQAEQAVEMTRRISGKLDDDVAFALESKGRALAAAGKLDAALAAFHEANAINEKVLAADHPKLLELLLGMGKVELAKRRPTAAAKVLERALAICERHDIGGKWRARVDFELARAVVKTDHARALALATDARVWYASSTLKHDLAEVDEWLAANRATAGESPR